MPLARNLVLAVLVAFAGVVLFFLLRGINPGAIQGYLSPSTTSWGGLLRLAAAVGLFLAFTMFAVAIVRYAISPLSPPSTTTSGDAENSYVRDRIAPIILAIGSLAILVTVVAVVASLTYLSRTDDTLRGKIDTVLIGMFSSVLPVFATWVGTVIAFYYTKDAFRQAAEATLTATSGVDRARHRVSERMIPYDSIAKIEVKQRDLANSKPMSEVLKLMTPPVTRVVIFEESTKNPIYILRKKLMPPDWIAQPPSSETTVKTYRELNQGANGSDSTNFGFISINSTIEQARQILMDTNSADIFVTNTGQKNESILGWLTNDILKGG